MYLYIFNLHASIQRAQFIFLRALNSPSILTDEKNRETIMSNLVYWDKPPPLFQDLAPPLVVVITGRTHIIHDMGYVLL